MKPSLLKDAYVRVMILQVTDPSEIILRPVETSVEYETLSHDLRLFCDAQSPVRETIPGWVLGARMEGAWWRVEVG